MDNWNLCYYKNNMEHFDTIRVVEVADEKLHICKNGIGKPLNFSIKADNYIICNYCKRIIGKNLEVQDEL